MVAGDLVNTASRIQSVAEPGSVFVGDATRRVDRADGRLRGRRLVRAQGQAPSPCRSGGRAGSSPAGAARSSPSGSRRRSSAATGAAADQGPLPRLRRGRARPPRLGDRDRRHRQVAALVGVLQVLRRASPADVYWHRGRCLPYGEGVTYWALADMVRMRCRIAEDEEPASAAGSSRRPSTSTSSTPDERTTSSRGSPTCSAWASDQARDRNDLFAAWRLFFERLADTYPTVLVFEDVHWADESLLDFVEYLLDWSRSHPLLRDHARRGPSCSSAGRRGAPGSGASPRSTSSRCPAEAMKELLDGLVPGLPAALRGQILARAEGVPLYAVETVRMLLDRGLLVAGGLVVQPHRPGRGARGARRRCTR